MNSLKSRAMNCGPLSEMILGFASGYSPWLVPELAQPVLMRLPCVRSIISKRGELFRHFQLRHYIVARGDSRAMSRLTFPTPAKSAGVGQPRFWFVAV